MSRHNTGRFEEISDYIEEEYTKTPITYRDSMGEFMSQKLLEIADKRAERASNQVETLGWQVRNIKAYRAVKERDKQIFLIQELQRLITEMSYTMYW